MKRFVSAPKKEFILPEGTYPAEIIGTAEVESSQGTPQIEVDFEVQTEDGTRKIKAWYNLLGYKKDDAGEYLLSDAGNRMKDKDNTEAALAIFCGLAHDAGIAADEGFEPEDLHGRQVGIRVAKNELGKTKVANSLSMEQVAV